MCGRYTQTAAFDELALRFGITVEDTAPEDLLDIPAFLRRQAD